MKEFTATTTINAKPEAIWAVLMDGAKYPEWDPSAERIEGKIAPGETIKAYTKLTPGRAFPAKINMFEPNKQMAWTGGMPLGLFKGVRTFTLTPKGNGVVEFTIREVFSGPLLGMIGKSLPDMTVPFQQFVEGLKKKAEGR
ncbi:MAG: SRPBCC domain-containing protein [Chloroflexia bacterium]